ncbi:hypothetical protein [Minwuia sp.]|uniref:hypothetical protein n=1 Tax=Minwuia sp. TaxID=2493630 RepID=UPI003A91CEBC
MVLGIVIGRRVIRVHNREIQSGIVETALVCAIAFSACLIPNLVQKHVRGRQTARIVVQGARINASRLQIAIERRCAGVITRSGNGTVVVRRRRGCELNIPTGILRVAGVFSVALWLASLLP